jgi:hypothetical protein
MKVCFCCKTQKNFDEFNKNKKTKDGRQSYCKVCQRLKTKEFYFENRDKRLLQRQEWRQLNKDKDKASYRRWKKKNPDSYGCSWKKYNAKRRKNVLLMVSDNLICERCGCDTIELLEINHKNGGGLKEVKRSNQKFYTSILNGSRTTDDLNILCKMCNILHYIEMKYGKQPYILRWNPNDE